MGKVYTRFQTKTAQNPTRWGGTHLCSLYKGVPPPGVHKTFRRQQFNKMATSLSVHRAVP